MGIFNGGCKPHNEDDLIVRSESEIEEFHQSPVIVLPNVEPAIILPTLLISSLTCEIISQSDSPHASQAKHDPLPARNLNARTMLLVEDEMCFIDDGKNRPNSINPRHFCCYLGEDKAESSQSESEGKSVLDRAFFAVFQKGKGGQVVGDLFEFLHIDNIIKITKINQKQKIVSFVSLQQMNRGERDRIIKIQELKLDESFSDLSKSQYSLKDVLNLNQFRELSQEIKLQQAQEQRLVDQFYYPTYKQGKNTFERKQQPTVSAYQQEYNKWKGQQQKQDNSFKSTYESTLALLNKQKQKQELKRLIQQSSIDNALFECSPNNAVLNNLNQHYSQSFHNLLNKVDSKPSYPLQPTKNNNQTQGKNYSSIAKAKQRQEEMQKQLNKERLIEIEVQKQLLQRIKRVDQQQKREQIRRQKEKQLKKACFKDLIQRPPSLKNRSQLSSASSIGQSKQLQPQIIEIKTERKQISRQAPSQKRQPHYKLNVPQILKIPHRLFLIFYSENYHQIVRLSSPQDLKAINSYQDQALARQAAVQKLQKKVAQEGSQFISKLPSQMKDKLFKILYQKDVQEQAYWEGR